MRYFKTIAILGIIVLASSGLAAQDIEYVSSILWNQVNDIAVENDIAYCAFDNGLEIIDFSFPEIPMEIGHIYLPGQTIRVKVAGHYAYVASVTEGLQIIDIANPAEPELIYTITETDNIDDIEIANDLLYICDGSKGLSIYHVLNPYDPALVFNERFMGRDISIEGSLLFLGGFNIGFQIFSLDDPQSPELLATVDLDYNAVGITVQGNYAYVSTHYELFVYDISDPEEPVFCSHFSTLIWNVAIAGQIGCIAGMTRELKIIDISNPYQIEELGDFPVEGYCEVVTINGNKAYIGNNWENLQAVDLTVPSQPVGLGLVEMHGRNSAFKVAGDYLYTGQFDIIDITNRENPEVVASLDIPVDFTELDSYGDYALLGGTEGILYIIDVSNAAEPFIVTTYDAGSRINDIKVNGTYAYIAANDSGMQILDISDPENPSYVTTFAITDAYLSEISIQANYAYLAYQSAGLAIADISDPANPQFISNLVLSNNSSQVYVRDNLAYMAGGNVFYIVDISDLLNPELISSWGAQGSAYDIYGDGHYAYMANGDVWIIDISDLPNCYEVGKYITPGWASQIYFDSGYIYIADRSSVMIFRFNPTDIDDDFSELPSGFALGQNYPNPFNACTEIQFDLKSAADVQLTVYDILGRYIESLMNSYRPAGSYNIIWDAADLPSGVYFYKLQAGNFSESRKCLLLK